MLLADQSALVTLVALPLGAWEIRAIVEVKASGTTEILQILSGKLALA